jgi:hypothetical protein
MIILKDNFIFDLELFLTLIIIPIILIIGYFTDKQTYNKKKDKVKDYEKDS